MLRKIYQISGMRSVNTLPVKLYRKRDYERRKRAMRYIKEEYDYITSARRNNILFDMALYKLDQMIAEMKFNHTYDPYTVLTVPRIRAQIKLTDKYDPQFRTKKSDIGGLSPPLNYLPSAVSFFPSLSFTSAPFSASGMGRPMRPAFSSMESPSLAM